MNEIKIKVKFKKGLCYLQGINLIQNDYNSTKLVFEFDDNEGTKIFEMKDDEDNVVFADEIINNELILVSHAVVTTKVNDVDYIKYTDGNDTIYWYDEATEKLYNSEFVEVQNISIDSLNKETKETSPFKKAGIYTFEVSLYKDNSKLTSAYEKIKVNAEQVIIDGEIVETYTPMFDNLLSDLAGALQETDNIDIDVEKVNNISTVSITKKDGTNKSVQIIDGLKGDKGDKGDTGDKGDKGANGADAKINGVNTLTIEAGTNITLEQEGNTLTINSERGTLDYSELINKPSINNITLNENKSLNDLGIQPAGNYLTSESDPTVPTYVKNITQANITSWNNKSDFSGDYNDLTNKPTIPTVPANVSAFENDAGYLTQHQDITGKEDKTNKVTSLSNESTDLQYPSAKAVYTNVLQVYNTKADAINNTVTGSVTQFNDGANNMPVNDITVQISPVQNLHGYSKPWAGGQNVNLLDPNKVSTMTGFGLTVTFDKNTSTFTISGEPTSHYSNMAFNFVNYANYSLSGKNYKIQALDIVGTPIRNIYGLRTESENKIAIMYDSTTYYTIDTTFKVSVSENTQSSWTPYANICPINGWLNTILNHSGENTNDPEVYNISWESQAGIVYGGNLDITTGLLTVTTGNIASYNGESLPSTWLSSLDEYIEGTTPTIGAQVVYTLSTPVTYQLTSYEINTILGINNFWASTGDVTVNYKADTTLYINNKLQLLDDRLSLLE